MPGVRDMPDSVHLSERPEGTAEHGGGQQWSVMMWDSVGLLLCRDGAVQRLGEMF